MNRESALFLTIIIFLLFLCLVYYGAQATLWSSIIFSILVSLILLNLFYPISQVTTEEANFSLYAYATFVVIGIVLLIIYIMQRTLCDVRTIDIQEV